MSSDPRKREKEKPKDSSNEFTSEYLVSKLKTFFKHNDFKSNLQKDAIKAILKRKSLDITNIYICFNIT